MDGRVQEIAKTQSRWRYLTRNRSSGGKSGIREKQNKICYTFGDTRYDTASKGANGRNIVITS